MVVRTHEPCVPTLPDESFLVRKTKFSKGDYRRRTLSARLPMDISCRDPVTLDEALEGFFLSETTTLLQQI